MIVVRDINGFDFPRGTAVTIGTFDGLHLGHLKLIEMLVESARETSTECVLITFEPHPRTVISGTAGLKLLTTIDEKLNVLSRTEISKVWVINFTMEFAQIDFEDFVSEYLVKKLNARHLIVGYDHKFGHNRSGDKNKLSGLGLRYGFDVSVLDEVALGEKNISSTRIRTALLSGDVKAAAEMLGRNYSFTGKVAQGKGRGKSIGFPTANVEIGDVNKLIPAPGVYLTACRIGDERHFGMMNIGYRPTFEHDGMIIPEVHIFDFDNEIYGADIEVEFISRIRDEKKFNSADELIAQINSDKETSQVLLTNLIN